MSEGSGEYRERPFGLSNHETFTAEEYGKALDNLRRFAEKDLTEIESLDDLAFEMRFIGQGLRMVVHGSGELKETKFDYEDPERGTVHANAGGYEIRQPVSDGRLYVSADKGIGLIIHETPLDKDHSRTDYFAYFPTDEEIRPTEDIDANLKARAVDYRNSQGNIPPTLHPAREPNNPAVQRGYAKVMQDGVKSVLEIAKPPTQLPPLE